MFTIHDDQTIEVTRGDILFFTVTAQDDSGAPYEFQSGDTLRITVCGKKAAGEIALQKDFPVFAATEEVQVYLSGEEMKLGGVISRPHDYWYEIELNPGPHARTILGYDSDGPKLLRLLPEGEEEER